MHAVWPSTAACARVAAACANDFRNRIPLDALRDSFPGLETPGGAPNLEPRDDVPITEAAPVVRATAGGGRELVQLRRSWPGAGW